MIRPAQAAGLAVPAILLLTLGIELSPAASSEQTPAAPLTLPAAGAAGAVNGPQANQWRATILARPLFNIARRPVRQAAAGSVPTLPRLCAIIVIGGVRSAIFATDGQEPQVVREGGAIAGYQVETIAPGEVDLAGPSGGLTLRPQFRGAAPAGSPPAPATPATPANPHRLDDDPI